MCLACSFVQLIHIPNLLVYVLVFSVYFMDVLRCTHLLAWPLEFCMRGYPQSAGLTRSAGSWWRLTRFEFELDGFRVQRFRSLRLRI